MKIVMLERRVLGMDVDTSAFSACAKVIEYPVSTNDQVAERIGDADCVVVNKLLMNEEHLKDCPNLKLILEAATGTDNIDHEYCASRGIKVKNVKGYSTQAVAQHTFALYFYLSEHLPYYDRYVKDGSYSNQPFFAHFDNYFSELNGKCWGVVGMGEIGRTVAKIADAFGAKVICCSPSGKKYDTPFEQVDFDTLLERSDVISLHTPLTDKTRNLFGRGEFLKMKKTAWLINVARGPIVNGAELSEAIDSGEIAGAGLDVMEKEPIPSDDPLLKIKNSDRIIITPHMAWGSVEARQRLVDDMFENLKGEL